MLGRSLLYVSHPELLRVSYEGRPLNVQGCNRRKFVTIGPKFDE
jgi:hypothetical protein